MNRLLARALGGAAGVGAVLAVLVSVPARWYGYRETDAHVFDPELFSPLWAHRILVPALGLLAGLLLLVGFAGLVVRDRRVADRLRRWSGYVVIVGLLLLVVTEVLFVIANPSGGSLDAIAGALFILVALVTGLTGLALSGAGLVAAGVGYARTDRPLVGYAMAGGTGLTVVLVAVGFVVEFSPLGAVPVVVPTAVAFAVVGYELATHPGPLREPERDHAAEADENVGEAGDEGASSAEADDNPESSNERGAPTGPDGRDDRE